MNRIFILLLCLSKAYGSGQGDIVSFDPQVAAFLDTYCVDCHGAEKQKGDRRLDGLAVDRDGELTIDFADPNSAMLVEEVLDMLYLGEMPPDKKKVRQPSDAEKRGAIDWFAQLLEQRESEKEPAVTVLRRLNRREYRNTIRDLLYLDEGMPDYTNRFPEDERKEGFSNIAEILSLSDGHLEQYLSVAEKYLDMAFQFDSRAKSKTALIKPQDWGYPEREPNTPWMYRVYSEDKYLDIGAGQKNLAKYSSLATVPRQLEEAGGVSESGYYRFEIDGEAINRLTHPYDASLIPVDLDPPMQLGLYIATDASGVTPAGFNARKLVQIWDLRDHDVDRLVATCWLDKGSFPFLNWDNGPGSTDWWMRDVAQKHHTDISFRGKQGAAAWHIIGKDTVPGRGISDVWQGPVVRVHRFAMKGPLGERYASQARRTYLEVEQGTSDVDFRKSLNLFAQKAFRRPVTEDMLTPYVELAESQLVLGRRKSEALLTSFKAILASPDFLYLKEVGDGSGDLDSYELASRLSYFLWGSMPDERLLRRAERGELVDLRVLVSEAKRLLDDRRSKGFVVGFSDSWLRLHKLGSMPPDKTKFPRYYDHGLERAMREETRFFVSHVLAENRPIADFLHSDYSFINEDLARHYGIDGVKGLKMRRVTLPPNANRGGLLGQASVLTVSANGVDTSPVVRGIWVLENLLGTPPSPPPPDVEPLEPDVRGSKTLRERLDKHRTDQACADCHAKIDPLGFPLEYFDPVGGYRSHYDKQRIYRRQGSRLKIIPGLPVDGRAELPTGEIIDDPEDLKQALLKREDQFARALAEKLMVYGTGRSMTYKEHGLIQRIVDSNASDGYGFRDMVLEVVKSETFRRK